MGSKKHKKHKSESKAGTDTDEGGQEKPLKLVLNIKMGGQGSSNAENLQETASPSSQDERSRHKHKKKKKKKSYDKNRDRSRDEGHSLKRPHEDDESNEEDDDDDEDDVRTERTTDNEDSDGNSSPSRKLREPRTCTIKGSDGIILKQMLNYLVKNLQNKDVNGFFAFPVTDTIAPGYSSIILHPMDFSTMTDKIESGDYCNVMDFKKDFILMCNNAMTYNRPETIYYKEAKRLLQLGLRQLSKEKLLHLKKTQSFLSSITLQELGFDESGAVITEPVPAATQVRVETNLQRPAEEPKPERDIDRFDAIPDDDLSPEEILSQAQDAAQAAKNALTVRKPKTDLGFLRMEDDGTTSMTILNPWNDGIVSSTQKVISLGDYMGKLKSGSGSLFKFKEDKRNKICPETYLCYGPFSSHAPSYDSSFASCTKEESDLLLHTYGGEIGVQYARSVQKFVENAGLSAVEMVDKLLDTLTGGQHSKSRVLLEEQKRKDEQAADQALQDEMIAKAQKAAEEAEAAKTGNKDGDISSDPVQTSLNQTAAMISDLYQTQTKRLSQDPPPHLALIAQPSDTETDLANKVTNSLVNMAKQVHPKDVVSTQAVRSALGITPVTQQQRQNQTASGSNVGQQNVLQTSKKKTKVRTMSDDSEDDDVEEDEDDEDVEEEDDEGDGRTQENVAGDTGNDDMGKQQDIVAEDSKDDDEEDADKDEVDGNDGDEEDEDESEEEDMEEG